MLELPEALVIAEQISRTLGGKLISKVVVNRSPHKFAWFHGDPNLYPGLLEGKTVESATSYGGLVEVSAGDMRILFGDGVNLRYCAPEDKLPAKHQICIQFEDSSSLVGSVQMYGGLWAFPAGQFDNPYYAVAKEKPSPLSDSFDFPYFQSLLPQEKLNSLSAKAFLATEQRIPGLGNGVLQDILWTSRIHPRRKMATLNTDDLHKVFGAVKSVLKEMVEKGGRDTERDLFGQPGGYQTILSKNTVDKPCPACKTTIRKATYMGGSIYYCENCQEL